jgi:GNAT superfamily N-acetyltransferase
VRQAEPADAGSVALVHVRSWQAAYRGLIPQDYLDALDPAQRERQWREWLTGPHRTTETWVVEHPTDGVIGFVTLCASRDEDAGPETGEVAGLYVFASHWGTGAGRLLISEAMRRLARTGKTTATLWVLETNDRARRFYESAGWHPDGQHKTDESRGFPLSEVRYRTVLTAVEAQSP